MNTRSFSFRAAVLLLLAGTVLAGCSPKRPVVPMEAPYDSTYAFDRYIETRRAADRSSMTQAERFAYDYRTAAMSRMRDEGVPLSSLHLIERAKTAIGTPYVSGGTGMDGFDCSGFVQWAYRDVGISLPRTAREQSATGLAIGSDGLMEGDIVAFSHPKRGYHTGIYIGKGKFIHSPGRGKSVSVAALSDPYFRSTFIGARRVRTEESDGEAVRKLMALDERKTHRAVVADIRHTRRSARKQTAAARRAAPPAEQAVASREKPAKTRKRPAPTAQTPDRPDKTTARTSVGTSRTAREKPAAKATDKKPAAKVAGKAPDRKKAAPDKAKRPADKAIKTVAQAGAATQTAKASPNAASAKKQTAAPGKARQTAAKTSGKPQPKAAARAATPKADKTPKKPAPAQAAKAKPTATPRTAARKAPSSPAPAKAAPAKTASTKGASAKATPAKAPVKASPNTASAKTSPKAKPAGQQKK